MKKSEILLLFDYNYWADYLLLAAAARVPHDQFIAPGGYARGGLRGTLVHTLDGEYGWHQLLHHGILVWNEDSSLPELGESEFETVEDLEKRWRLEETLMRDYLASLDDSAMESIVRYTTDEGEKRERVLWHCLFHVVNHGTQHRSETAALLTSFGYSPGDVDFTMFMLEHK